jgi:hypothetical protein
MAPMIARYDPLIAIEHVMELDNKTAMNGAPGG